VALGGAARLELLKWESCGASDETIAAARASLAAARGLPAAVQAKAQHEHRMRFAFDRNEIPCDVCSASSEEAGLGYVCDDCNYDLCLLCAAQLGTPAEAESEDGDGDEEDEDGSGDEATEEDKEGRNGQLRFRPGDRQWDERKWEEARVEESDEGGSRLGDDENKEENEEGEEKEEENGDIH
jgi:hypothetical protein